jgi:hypothetical protein
MFNPIQKGDHGLTEEAVYMSIQDDGRLIPLWGGNAEHENAERYVSAGGRTKFSNPITIFTGPGVVISLDGSAGSMTYKSDNAKFALNHHAGFFTIKDGTKVRPDYFAIYHQSQMEDESVSSGSKTLTLEKVYWMDFDIPDRAVQDDIMSSILPLMHTKRKIEGLLRRFEAIRARAPSEKYTSYQGMEVPIREILDCVSGNSGLTEEYIYSIVSDPSPKLFKVLTGSENVEDVEMVHLCPHPKDQSRTIITYSGECVHVIRKGKAGKLTYVPAGKYTLNDDAYLLTPKRGSRYQISMKWIPYACQQASNEYASSADNGTWNKTGFFEHAAMDVPVLAEQERVAREFEPLWQLEVNLQHIVDKIDALLRRKPAE